MDLIHELEQKAAQGDVEAKYALAMKLIYGEGVTEDNVRAARLLEEAALEGHREAAYQLGVCYHYGYGVEVDLRTAYQLYLRSAMQGYGKGLTLVGDFYAEGICVRQSWREAIKWYLDAANSTDLSAAGYAEYKLALILAEGRGVEADPEGAREWFRKAIDHGEERASAALENLGVDDKCHIREARLNDAEAIWRLNVEAVGHEYPLELLTQQLSSILDSRAHKIFVAAVNGKLVGYVHGTDFVSLYAPPMKRVLTLAVDTSFRGRGIGGALLEKIEEWAVETDCYTVCITIEEERLDGRACIGACGYERTPDQVHFRKLL